MELFACECGATVFFDNTRCLNCQREIGYSPDARRMLRLDRQSEIASHAGSSFVKCSNYAKEQVCNWLVSQESAEAQPFCVACRLNETIPNLSEPANRVYWAKIEAAKRRLVYSLLRLGLPLRDRNTDAEGGLAFRFLADPPPGSDGGERVLTGHASGVITLNIREADEVQREQIRQRLDERYRTLLGHFRHESGHFYWDELVRDSPELASFRELFGDERADYAASLAKHYGDGPSPDWQASFVSSYAASHPWEDFAETWAHYLHISDSLETARNFEAIGLTAAPTDFDQLVRAWVRLSLALNSINRSMGLPDTYPFVLSPPSIEKLRFVDAVVRRAGAAASAPPPVHESPATQGQRVAMAAPSPSRDAAALSQVGSRP